jgi:pimeloyl-ACP methyl ester carboxylesterase
VTAFLRIDDPGRGLLDGELHGTLELYTLDEGDTVEVDGQAIPLEFESTVALAASLEGAPIWDLETSAFFSGDVQVFRQLSFDEGILMTQPYDPERIPVVMVHGTASSAARWAELINELENDPELADRIQIWLFTYNSGNPIPYSAGLLHAALAELVGELDPEGDDPALRDMVVIGHSQGGLLTKMTAIRSGDRLWELVSDRPVGDLDLSPEARELAQRSYFYEPLPFVKRLVFIATPHRGSYLTAIAWAGFRPSRLITRLITLPFTLVSQGFELTQWSDQARVRRASERMPTSIDQMTPGDGFLEALLALPVVPGIEYHSIIAVKGDGPAERGADGVVQYESAHLEGAVSEKVVRSGHSTQAHPATIEEVRRIVRAHVTAQP